MPDVLHPQVAGPPVTPLLPGTGLVDERAARRTLRDQIARLEKELSSLFCSTYPRLGFEWSVRSGTGPRVLSTGELEVIRDGLVDRLAANRKALGQRTRAEEQSRILIEEMMLAPAEHRWVRVQNADIGERGCKQWHVRPKWGPVGVLMSWWRVVVSSGCPLARGRGRGP
jgi:hypothetical protein